MEVNMPEVHVNVGDVIEIDERFYIVNRLIGCVDWDRERGEYYLHKLSGEGFFSYPTTLEQLSIKIKDVNGKIYTSNQFKLNLELIGSVDNLI